MRLGLLADIHEDVSRLRWAVDALSAAGVSKYVILGDVFEMGRAVEETVGILAALDSVGVWGNHDFGLCRDVEPDVRRRYSAQVLDYFGSLQPWVEIGHCRFQHIEPFFDSEQLEDLWAHGSGCALDPRRSFNACLHQRIFMGHVHQWAVHTPDGQVPWCGEGPLRLDPRRRTLIAVHAVQQGWCCWYDIEEDFLHALRAD